MRICVNKGNLNSSIEKLLSNPALLCFLALTAALSTIFWALIIVAGHVGAGAGHYVSGLMWCPAIAAFLTVYIRRLDPASLGLRWSGGRYAVIAYLTQLAYAALAYSLIWLCGGGFFPDPNAIAAISGKLGWHITSPGAFVPLYLLLLGTTVITSVIALALWRRRT
jgi:hypothetical protein